MLWRPVIAGYDTLSEVKYSWNIDDLFDSHELLDMKEEQDRRKENGVR
jgi:ABC-type uncharacterized transport system substrate-binding protein